MSRIIAETTKKASEMNKVFQRVKMQYRQFILPAMLFAFNLGCSLESFARGDWKRGVYWIASAVCIAAVSI
jgi:hypothetical protein